MTMRAVEEGRVEKLPVLSLFFFFCLLFALVCGALSLFGLLLSSSLGPLLSLAYLFAVALLLSILLLPLLPLDLVSLLLSVKLLFPGS
ncbi:hypothetical protein Tco_0578657 [Tanacetum coccineum]